jgi:hypothetical protein
MTAGSIRHDGTVLTGVKAKPFGWPPASPDPGSGRRILATIEAAAPTPTKIKFQLRGVSTVRGDCRRCQRTVPGFPVAFRLSAFASWVILRPLGS